MKTTIGMAVAATYAEGRDIKKQSLLRAEDGSFFLLRTATVTKWRWNEFLGIFRRNFNKFKRLNMRLRYGRKSWMCWRQFNRRINLELPVYLIEANIDCCNELLKSKTVIQFAWEPINRGSLDQLFPSGQKITLLSQANTTRTRKPAR